MYGYAELNNVTDCSPHIAITELYRCHDSITLSGHLFPCSLILYIYDFYANSVLNHAPRHILSVRASNSSLGDKLTL